MKCNKCLQCYFARRKNILPFESELVTIYCCPTITDGEEFDAQLAVCIFVAHPMAKPTKFVGHERMIWLPLTLKLMVGDGGTIFSTVTLFDALQVIPPVVKLAVIRARVLLVTSPALNNPKGEILAVPKSSLQTGFTTCDDPSLNKAAAENCDELFSLTELDPEMLREVSVGVGGTLMTVTG